MPRLYFVTILFLFLLTGTAVFAKVNTALYDVTVDVAVVKAAGLKAYDSVLMQHPQLANKNVVVGVVRPRVMQDKTTDFYILLGLFALLGVLKYSDPQYFQSLWKALRNPVLSGRQIKDQILGAYLPNFIMNIFFIFVGGLYIYYLIARTSPRQISDISPLLLMLVLVGGVGLIYLLKYLVVRFSGWAFNIEGISENYIYNIFLINKLTAIVLLPFTVILAFSDAQYVGPVIIVSVIAVLIMFINRYTRSWPVFGSFFQYSKFHFFTYLCASELLPMAVLMKIIVGGWLY